MKIEFRAKCIASKVSRSEAMDNCHLLRSNKQKVASVDFLTSAVDSNLNRIDYWRCSEKQRPFFSISLIISTKQVSICHVSHFRSELIPG